MKLNMCAVRDSAADSYMNPFFSTSTGIAIRSFRDEVNRKAEGNTLAAHPSDFELYQLGYFDPGDGSFEVMAKPHLLIRGKDCAGLEG